MDLTNRDLLDQIDWVHENLAEQLEAILTYLHELSDQVKELREQVYYKPRKLKPKRDAAEPKVFPPRVVELYRAFAQLIKTVHRCNGLAKCEARDLDVVAKLVKKHGDNAVADVIMWLWEGSERAIFWVQQVQGIQGLCRRRDGLSKFEKILNAMNSERAKHKPAPEDDDWESRFERLEKQFEAR